MMMKVQRYNEINVIGYRTLKYKLKMESSKYKPKMERKKTDATKLKVQ